MEKELDLDQHEATRLDLAVKAMQYNEMLSIQMANDWNGNLGQWYYDIELERFYFNPMFMLVMGKEITAIELFYDFEQFIEGILDEDRTLFGDTFQEYINGNSPVIEFVFRIEDVLGQCHHIYISGQRAHEQWHIPYINGEIFDVSKQYMSRKEQKKFTVPENMASTHDQLTGILTATYFYEHLRHTITLARAGQKGFSLLSLDLDFFKNINAHFGRDKGDEVLKEVGRVLRKETRNTDFSGRVGGDRFMVVLTDVDLKVGQIIAERIKKSIANHMFVSGIRITVSGGLVSYNKESYDELLTNVDGLLKKSKNSGHNSITYK